MSTRAVDTSEADRRIVDLDERTYDAYEVDAAGDGDIDLTGATARFIRLTGERTGSGTITFDDDARSYWIQNETTGGFTLSAKTSGGSVKAPLTPNRNIRAWAENGEARLSYYRTQISSDDMGADFTSGQFVVVREGDIVAVTGALGHNQAADIVESGIVPEWGRPGPGSAESVHWMDSGGLLAVRVESTGNLRFRYREFSGADDPRFGGSFTVTYNV